MTSARYRGTTAQLDANAIELRRNQTPTEKALWELLRNRQLAGMKFRRQHSVGPFVLDFYCAQFRLAVELDGQSHVDRQEYDLRRTAWLNAVGISVVRFQNEDVVMNVDKVLEEIEQVAGEIAVTPEPGPDRGLALTPDPSPVRELALTPDPSPVRGRGEEGGE